MDIQELREFRFSGLSLCHGAVRHQFIALHEVLLQDYERKLCKSMFMPFETYRTPLRQDWLFEHTKTTKVKAWYSPHQYGLAVDFVPWKDGKTNQWTWDEKEDWNWLDTRAKELGLHRPIAWDRPHIEHPLWAGFRNDMRRYE